MRAVRINLSNMKKKTGIEWQDLQVTNSAFWLAIVAMLTDRAQAQCMHLCMVFTIVLGKGRFQNNLCQGVPGLVYIV